MLQAILRPRGLHWSTVFKLLAPAKRNDPDRPRYLFLCVADHYEPMFRDPPAAQQIERVDRWVNEYPKLFSRFRDARGKPPQQTFFYPAEVYTPEHLERLALLCGQGYGDVEVHLHHDNDTADGLRRTLLEFTRRLRNDHGLLRENERGQIEYAFIHGNWALDNSRPDGRWCGVNNEISILRETGCYVDMTLPSAPSLCQTRAVNRIYYAVDDPQRPNSHDQGAAAEVGKKPPTNGLLMIQGPLALDWGRRKAGVLPGLENADLHGGRPPTMRRLRMWEQAGVGVVGRPDWIFVKLHTHGAPEKNAKTLLGEEMVGFHQALENCGRQTPGLKYYYVTAREMARLVHQAESGVETPDLSEASHSGAAVDFSAAPRAVDVTRHHD